MADPSTTGSMSVLSGPLAEDGFTLCRDIVPSSMIGRLVAAVDAAVASEAALFPPGDDQHGRVLFAPAHGGAFLELLLLDALFDPIEAVLGDDAILYTMTTSVLAPGTAGPVHEHHVDLPADRPDGLAISAILLLDPFTAESGATEFIAGSHRGIDGPAVRALGEPGDVCYFDPRVRHRSVVNRSGAPRRAVLIQMVRPWMKQRVDVTVMLSEASTAALPTRARRRLGLTALPPRSTQEFIARRTRRPWS